METEMKAAAEVSMGTEIAPEDVSNIRDLCDQVGASCTGSLLGWPRALTLACVAPPRSLR